MYRCKLLTHSSTAYESIDDCHRVKGRPHYYSPKKEEYAHIKFDLDAGGLLPFEGNNLRVS